MVYPSRSTNLKGHLLMNMSQKLNWPEKRLSGSSILNYFAAKSINKKSFIALTPKF
jgi:hypothetical protein